MRLLTTWWTALVLLVAPSFAWAEDAKPLRVAIYDDQGARGAGIPKVTEQLGRTKDIRTKLVSGEAIAGGALKDYDVVVFTGGSGSQQAEGLGEKGRAEVRAFVDRGGGYVGICAGAYLACSGFSWGVGVLDAKTVSPKWRRGVGMVRMEVTTDGHTITGLPVQATEVKYSNGPILKPAGRDDIPDFETLARFRTELAENDTPQGVMVDSPAIASGRFGKGRVIVASPHPEQTPGLEVFAEHAVRWSAGR